MAAFGIEPEPSGPKLDTITIRLPTALTLCFAHVWQKKDFGGSNFKNYVFAEVVHFNAS